MKTINPKQPRSRGSVLIVTMCVLAVSAIVLASYFMLVQNQTSSVARSQTWNAIIPVSEAGVEDGMALVNKYAPNTTTNGLWGWTSNLTADGWSSLTNGRTSVTRTVAGSNYYTATIDITSGSPVITSIGVVPYTRIPWGTTNASAAEPFLAQIGLGPVASSGNVGRKVQVETVLNTLFTAAVITKSNFNMNGNGTTVDSFDSSSALYSTLGQYTAALRRANGDVATDSSIVGGVSIGNGNIFGHVKTGPGTVQSAVQIGPNGAVGDTTWQASNSGIQSNYWSGDFNVNIPDVLAPATGTTSLPAVDSNNMVPLNGGNYTIALGSSNLDKVLKITAPTTLWVQGSYSPKGIVIVSSNNASLVLYVGRTNGSGDSTTLAGQTGINAGGYARNLQFYGLPSLTSLSMHGNAAFIGTIYAPSADATFGGGGNTYDDTSGAIIVKSLTLGGHWNFHYDENLSINGPNRGWIAKNWTEVRYP